MTIPNYTFGAITIPKILVILNDFRNTLFFELQRNKQYQKDANVSFSDDVRVYTSFKSII